jgi:hypothetical protein
MLDFRRERASYCAGAFTNVVPVSLEVESSPEFGGSEITTELQKPAINSAQARIPFLNPSQQMTFSLQAIDTQSERCVVTAGAPGLAFVNLAPRRHLRELTIAWTIGLVLSAPGLVTLGLVQTGTIRSLNEYEQSVFLDIVAVVAVGSLTIGLLALVLLVPWTLWWLGVRVRALLRTN